MRGDIEFGESVYRKLKWNRNTKKETIKMEIPSLILKMNKVNAIISLFTKKKIPYAIRWPLTFNVGM